MTSRTEVDRSRKIFGMLNLSRRHTPKCPHRKKGRAHIKCKCPIWVDGELHGKRFRRSTGVRDWQRALRKVAAWENHDGPRPKRVCEALEAFLRSCRDLASASERKYRNVCNQFQRFCESQTITTLAELTVEDLDLYCASRELSPLSSQKELQTLRQIYSFWMDRRWIADNHAQKIRPPRGARPRPVDPYTPAEVSQLITACDKIGRQNYERLRARAMVLMMRYTGLRISDVITLSRDRVRDGYLQLHTQKTGGHVLLPMPSDLREALETLPIPKGADRGCPFFFWNGKTSRRQVVTMAHKSLDSVFRRAGVENARSHRFRHTLATEILTKGGTEQDVADILGISPAIVRKHYAKWSLGRQKRVINIMRAVHGTRGYEEFQELPTSAQIQ